VDVPFNRMITSIIHDCESGVREPDPGNLRDLRGLLP
jgi:hypothetical protein